MRLCRKHPYSHASRLIRLCVMASPASVVCGIPSRVSSNIWRGGDSVEQVLAEFPDLERDDILACLEFSRKMLAAKSVHLALT